MEPQTEQPPGREAKLKGVWWIAAGAMTVATVLVAVRTPGDWMAIVGRGSLVAAMVLLATARPAETRAKKVLIYALCAVSLALLIARIVTR